MRWDKRRKKKNRRKKKKKKKKKKKHHVELRQFLPHTSPYPPSTRSHPYPSQRGW